MFDLRPSAPEDADRIMDIWRKAVDDTHAFLTPDDRAAIERELAAFFPQVELILAIDPSKRPVGFMYLHDGHMEALFVDPDHHGKGVGRKLVQNALALHPALTTDVNEQNVQAVGFYERIGFKRMGRSERDGQGRPYPLLHLRFQPGG
ncbi:acetyltransferase [Rhizobiaceae bacterium BDR2-2]|uniref:Acetyltransferase n=1 Tax=Ectorhizobium quercum TaxID=2965071 RepID=A0AAE3N621_9HYPH|nr:acetyltransferase [Ectorhizobium quercum]MCX8999182.1 acetyltransferase [Ectorhizobium quercum]